MTFENEPWFYTSSIRRHCERFERFEHYVHVTLDKIRSKFCQKNGYYSYKTTFPITGQRKVEKKSKIKLILLPLHSPHSVAMFNVLKMLIAMVIMLWFVTQSIVKIGVLPDTCR